MNTETPKLHEGYWVMPPFDSYGARYDLIDEETEGLDPLQRHSINCRCLYCEYSQDGGAE